jgi:hypothetical protein
MILKIIAMGLFKFIKKGGIKDIQKIARLVKASKAAKTIAASSVAVSVVPEAPVDPTTALMIAAVSMLADMFISYLKGREHKK